MSASIEYFSHERSELVAQVDEGARRVLDVGCGTGNISAAIKRNRHAMEIWGIELVPEVARQAEKNPALDRVICGDAAQAIKDLEPGSFSHIVAGDVLEHLEDPWSVLAGLYRCLEPGGKFISSIPNIRNLSFLFQLFVLGRFKYKDSGVLDRTHLRFFTRKDIQLMFEGAGFENIQISAVRPKKNPLKIIGRWLFRDLVLKGFLVTATRPKQGQGGSDFDPGGTRP